MSVYERPFPTVTHGAEREVILTDYDESYLAGFTGDPQDFDGTQLRIHPWKRPGFGIHENAVHVQVGAVDANERVIPMESDEGLDYSWSGIFQTDEFIEAVLLAFPNELQRKVDEHKEPEPESLKVGDWVRLTGDLWSPDPQGHFGHWPARGSVHRITDVSGRYPRFETPGERWEIGPDYEAEKVTS